MGSLYRSSFFSHDPENTFGRVIAWPLTVMAAMSGLLMSQPGCAQTVWSGVVFDQQQRPVAGANVYLKNTYYGATTDSTGAFTFAAEPMDTAYLLVSAIGYQTHEHRFGREDPVAALDLRLPEATPTLSGVTITAGAFEAGDERKAITLEPLDMVTTAGALGDIAGALQTLPGTQTVGEDGRLFVRGGEGYETKVFIDGLLAHTPFNASVAGIPTRGRFSPFLFKGTTFSTGGYSAEYGQALSSALLLRTTDLDPQTQTDLSLMTVGGSIAHQHRWEESSVWVEGGYTNLAPYQWAVPPDVQWEVAPQAVSGSAAFRHQTSSTGVIKMYTQAGRSRMSLYQPDIQRLPATQRVALENDNLYVNASFREAWGKRWTGEGGVSYTYDDQLITIDQMPVRQQQRGWHAKMVGVRDFASSLALRLGAEYFRDQYNYQFTALAEDRAVRQALTTRRVAQFAEADVYFTPRLVARLGGRAEHSLRASDWSVSPRMSLAYKTGRESQVSLAYGGFRQDPQLEYRLINPDLEGEMATHYIANYQRTQSGRTFRAEMFYKQYRQLVKFDPLRPYRPERYTNRGRGYARGLDIFWRDRRAVSNLDYWLSYSFLDSERDYQDFPQAAVPTFVSRHNFSAVGKYFVTNWRTQVGASYTFASGRPYFNPGQSDFHADRTPAFHSLSVNAAWLVKQHIILYAAATNVLGRDNIFGYRYASQPNEFGTYDRQAVRPTAPRFFFVGLFITLSKDQLENQLDNL